MTSSHAKLEETRLKAGDQSIAVPAADAHAEAVEYLAKQNPELAM